MDAVNELSESTWIIMSTHIPLHLGGTANSRTFVKPDECESCTSNKAYPTLASAIEHLHQNHIVCLHECTTAIQFDDPCVGWTRRILSYKTDLSEEALTRTRRTLAITRESINSLWDIHDEILNLHCLVSGTTDSTDGTNFRPHLVSSLVNALESIVTFYVLKGREIHWTNKIENNFIDSDCNSQRLKKLRRRCKAAEDKIYEDLNLAKGDIILLGTTRRNLDRPVMASVGSEFLVACLVGHLQRNTILQDKEQKVDIFKHFERFAMNLRFHIGRDPTRRRFRDISALEEELEALAIVVQIQRRTFLGYRTALDPDASDSSSTDLALYKARQSLFNLESKYIDSQDRKLEERELQLHMLQRKAQAMKHDMKQNIEILDEGHGKAIRAFTLVTLFFLPL